MDRQHFCQEMLLRPFSALFFTQRGCNVTKVQRVSRYWSFPAAFRSLAGIHVHRSRDGMHRMFPEISKSLPRVLLADALLKGLTFVPELNDGLRVGVDGGDRCAHAAGEGCPGHADGKQEKKKWISLCNSAHVATLLWTLMQGHNPKSFLTFVPSVFLFAGISVNHVKPFCRL